ncbi:MBL fold metallo-hydrolase [Vibrio sp. 10N.247.311.64]|uniref:MBL fold metallo-hydrolase n=1 Tax=Vibrio sp. 10N.247.311.64 TaxID=3229997 RepID=UPI0035532329
MELITLTDSNADSFLIKISGEERTRHILIDGGYKQDARRALALIERIIEEHGKIDLVVLTHVDTDHINGLLAIFKSEKVKSSTIDKVLFNVPHSQAEMAILKAKPTQCGYDHGNKLLKIILDKNIHIESAVKGDVHYIDDDIKIDILAPTVSAVKEDHREWRNTNIGHDGDINYDKEALIKEEHIEDKKPQNVSSIVCLIKSSERSVLLCGDSVPSQITAGMTDVMPVDLFKIPHHGSKFNINKELLRLFPSRKYLIPGNRTDYPNFYTIALIEDKSEGSIIYVPNGSWVHKEKFNKNISLDFVSYNVSTRVDV